MTIPERATAERPLPIVDMDTAPFWDALKQRKLVLQRCADCDAYQHPPRPMCHNCNGFNVEWVESKGRGEVYSWIIVTVPSHPFFWEVPYNVVLVEMHEGVRLFANLVDVAPEEIKEGMPVRADFVDADEGFCLLQFRRA